MNLEDEARALLASTKAFTASEIENILDDEPTLRNTLKTATRFLRSRPVPAGASTATKADAGRRLQRILRIAAGLEPAPKRGRHQRDDDPPAAAKTADSDRDAYGRRRAANANPDTATKGTDSDRDLLGRHRPTDNSKPAEKSKTTAHRDIYGRRRKG